MASDFLRGFFEQYVQLGSNANAIDLTQLLAFLSEIRIQASRLDRNQVSSDIQARQRFNSPEILAILCQLLSHPDFQIRIGCVRAFGEATRFATSESPHFVERALQDANPGIHVAVLGELGNQHASSLKDVILQSLKHSNPL